jgi:hypothetical protein
MAATKKTPAPVETSEETQALSDVQIESQADAILFNYREEELKRQEAHRNAAQASLNEPFSPDVERELKKGGTYLVYIPVSEVINRLNKVLGYDGWSYEIVKCERDAIDPDFIVAHVRMSVYPQADRFVSITRDGFGGQKIKRTKNGDIVDLGDEFKGAVSDALKKAAQSIGVGLYLARTEEAMALDESPAAQNTAPVQQASAPAPIEQVSDLYQNFIELRQSLDEEGVSALRTFWAKYSGGRPVPKPAEFTDEELKQLIAECLRQTFKGGKFEDEPA